MLTDFELEQKWDELADVPFYEDFEGRLLLVNDWWIFDANTGREDIWHYFDEEHSKGVHWLLYERQMEVTIY